VTEYSSVTIQGNPCQNQLELANTLPQLYTKIKLIQGNKHLNGLNLSRQSERLKKLMIKSTHASCFCLLTPAAICLNIIAMTVEDKRNV
jgi:hypothetical protein